MLHLGEFDDEDRVLRGEADEHDDADLREHIVHVALAEVPARRPQSDVRAEGGERRAEQHAEWKAPALVLRCEDEEHEQDRQCEDHGHARSLRGSIDVEHDRAGFGGRK